LQFSVIAHTQLGQGKPQVSSNPPMKGNQREDPKLNQRVFGYLRKGTKQEDSATTVRWNLLRRHVTLKAFPTQHTNYLRRSLTLRLASMEGARRREKRQREMG